MAYEPKTKKVSRVDFEGNHYFEMVKIPFDAANPERQAVGIRSGNIIYFPDGSTKDGSYGNCFPPPSDDQYPKEIWFNKERYFRAKSERLSAEFDKIQNRLLEREDSFMITLPNGEQVDAVKRLHQLGSQIVKSEKKRKIANVHLGRELPEEKPPHFTKQELKEYAEKEKRIQAFRESVVAIERPEVATESTRLTGTR